MSCGMRVPGQRMADDDRVAGILVEAAVGLVRDLDRRQAPAGLEHERPLLGEEDRPLGAGQPDRARAHVPVGAE